MNPIEIIKKPYGSIKQIARDTGLDYQTLRRFRLKEGHLGRMTLAEFWQIQRHGYFTDEELLEICKWGTK